MNFWEKLPKPFFCLAPMADVTDASFRRVIAQEGKPDVMWTEFVSADGLMHPVGREKLKLDLIFTEAERPIVAQLFGARPEQMEGAARYCRELGFDGIDINMGCPDKTIEKQCAGAAMMRDPKLAREIIRAAKRGAGDVPVSVKTRIGYNKNEIENWIPELLAENIAALTIHARTRKEMSKVPARWEHVREVVEMRNRMGVRTLIIGNGDVKDLEEARNKVKETGCDGVMLGRAIFGNPWLFSKNQNGTTVRERLLVLVEHTKLFEEILGKAKSFALMKKHYKSYIEGHGGFPGAKELRMKLMDEAQNASDVERIVNEFLKSLHA